MEFKENLEIKDYKTGRGVYFLMSEFMEVIYIGSSLVDYNTRIASHRDKDYCFYAVLDMSREEDQDILDKEAEMIVKYRPIMNKSLPFNRTWKRLPDRKKKRDRLIKKQDLEVIKIKETHYSKTLK